MSKISKAITTTVTSRHRINLERDDIVRALHALLSVNLPPDATIEFNVPGGGDWSNTSIDISRDNPIVVSWSETKTKEI